MDKDLANYLALFFYTRGYADSQNENVKYNRNKKLDGLVQECIKKYNDELEEEKRKDSPHHHTNRFDQ